MYLICLAEISIRILSNQINYRVLELLFRVLFLYVSW